MSIARIQCSNCGDEIDTAREVWYVVFRREYGKADVKTFSHEHCYKERMRN